MNTERRGSDQVISVSYFTRLPAVLLSVAAALLGAPHSTSCSLADVTKNGSGGGDSPALRISSPAPGSIVRPGDWIHVTVVSSSDVPVRMVTLAGDSAPGSVGIVNTLPAEFDVRIPATTAAGPLVIQALGKAASGLVESDPIELDVERQDSPVKLKFTSGPKLFLYQSMEQQVLVIGEFADGVFLDVTRSSYLQYSADNQTIASVNRTGMVRAEAPGNTWISARYVRGGHFVWTVVELTVPEEGLRVSQATLDFSNQAIGSSATLRLIATNSSQNVPLKILRLEIGGDYTESDDCQSSSLAPGDSCTIQVTFKPSITGPDRGSLQISHDSGVGILNVTLLGTGTHP